MARRRCVSVGSACLMAGALALLGVDAHAGPATDADKAAPKKTAPKNSTPSSAPSKTAPATPPSPGTTTPPSPGTRPGSTAPATPRDEPQEDQPPQDLSNTWGYSRGGTLKPRYTRSTEDPIFYGPNPIGFYSGVSLQGNKLPPHPAQQPGKRPVTLTWTGFERKGGGSRVFFQLSAEPSYEVRQNGTRVVIRMANTKVPVKNNRRPLDLRYFKTAVQAVDVRRSRRDAVATITLNRDVTASVDVVPAGEPAGYHMLVVRFDDATEASQENDGPPPAPNAN